ncbi:MAG: trigger factor [Bacteroidota bacterium]
MQITEANTEGLKRTLKIVVGASELNDRFTTRLDEVKDTVQLKGFRRGKVPVQHIKKVFGRSLMAEVVQQALEESSRKVMDERKERPAFQPKIELTEDKTEIENVMAGKGDLAYTMSFEVLPEIKLTDFSGLKLERLVADVTDDVVDKAINDLAERNLSYEAEEGRAAQEGDQLTIDFVGSIDGAEFEGGKGTDVPIVLGAGGFIPGFAEGLKEAKAGEQRVVKATFPPDYPVPALAGKEASFEVNVKAVGKPVKPQIDDSFAKGFGVDSLDALKERIRSQIDQEYQQIARAKLKRQVLDSLDAAHDFALPPTLVDNEFESIWAQMTDSLKRANKTFEDEGKTEEQMRSECRSLAERRVRLGLILGEAGLQGKIEVTQDELRAALFNQARRFPGQERAVYEYYEKTPGAIMELRGPIFEDKTIDYIVAQAKPTERKVSREELLKPADDEELHAHIHDGEGAHAHHHHHHHDHDHDHHHHDHGHDHDHHGHDHGQVKKD